MVRIGDMVSGTRGKRRSARKGLEDLTPAGRGAFMDACVEAVEATARRSGIGIPRLVLVAFASPDLMLYGANCEWDVTREVLRGAAKTNIPDDGGIEG